MIRLGGENVKKKRLDEIEIDLMFSNYVVFEKNF